MEQDSPGITSQHADQAALFEQLFKTHFTKLHRYACSLLKDEAWAEEIVQNVFCRLWEKREQLFLQHPVTGYLFKSVYNESLNALKHEKIKTGYRTQISLEQRNHHTYTNHSEVKELHQRIQLALSELPEQCRTVFQLSRYEELKYKEIADLLGISVKTVENHMSKALRILKTKLAPYLPVLGLFIVNLEKLKQ